MVKRVKQMGALVWENRKRIGKAVRLLAIIGVVILCVIVRLPSRQTVAQATLPGTQSRETTGVLGADNKARQRFCFGQDVKLKRLDIAFVTEKKETDCAPVVLLLKDEKKKTLFSKTIAPDKIEKKGRTKVSLGKGVTLLASRSYYLILKTKGETPGPAVQLSGNTAPNKRLIVAHTAIPAQCLGVIYNYEVDDSANVLRMFIAGILLLLLLVLPYRFLQRVGDVPGVGYAFFFVNPTIVLLLTTAFYDNASTFVQSGGWYTYLLLLALQMIVFGVVWNKYVAMLVFNAACFLLALVNLQVTRFKGMPLLPSDLLFARTALDVSGGYTITWSHEQLSFMVFMLLYEILLALLITSGRSRKPSVLVSLLPGKESVKKWIRRGMVTVVHVAFLVVGILGVQQLYTGPMLAENGIAVDIWNRTASVKKNGLYLDFFMNFHYLTMKKPENYSVGKVEKIIAATTKQATTDTTAKTGQKPNIIVIMNESLADYSLLDQGNAMTYSEDYLPNIHGLQENVIKGKCYVSVFGSMTPNSEFECLTGNSLAFFPINTVPYQQFIGKHTYALPTYLKTLGYDTLAMHPCAGSNWNRTRAYESMKFDRFLTLNQFKQAEKIRNHVSDWATYEKIISRFQKKKAKKPLFVMDVTMQNHGGYTNGTQFAHPVTAGDGSYPLANEYLSSAYLSDAAYARLLSYFKTYKEPTLILMFGDHQPNIEPEFVAKVLGDTGNGLGLAALQEKYCTPYILWANYDIDTKTDGVTSTNFLSNLVLQQAGLPYSVYHQYLRTVQEQIPAMNAYGYRTTDGNWHDYTENTKVSAKIEEYHAVEYGYFRDGDKKQIRKLFGY